MRSSGNRQNLSKIAGHPLNHSLSYLYITIPGTSCDHSDPQVPRSQEERFQHPNPPFSSRGVRRNSLRTGSSEIVDSTTFSVDSSPGPQRETIEKNSETQNSTQFFPVCRIAAPRTFCACFWVSLVHLWRSDALRVGEPSDQEQSRATLKRSIIEKQ